jgi:hypothetical protein
MFLSVAEMQNRVSELEFREWAFEIYEGAFEGPHLKILALEEDSTRPGAKVKLEIHIPVAPYETISGFDMWLLKRLIRITTHETMEFFKDKATGLPVIDPHRDGADKDLI